VHPSAHSSPQPKRQIDRFSRFCTADSRKSPCFTMGASIPQNGHFPWGVWTHLTHDSLGHPSSHPKRHLDRFSRFCTDDADCPYTLQWDAPLPLKIAPFYGGSGPPSNTWFLRPTRVFNPNGISIASAVFAGLTSVTDRPTDHATRSETIGRIYVRSTAMWPNNI